MLCLFIWQVPILVSSLCSASDVWMILGILSQWLPSMSWPWETKTQWAKAWSQLFSTLVVQYNYLGSFQNFSSPVLSLETLIQKVWRVIQVPIYFSKVDSNALPGLRTPGTLMERQVTFGNMKYCTFEVHSPRPNNSTPRYMPQRNPQTCAQWVIHKKV